MVVLGGLVVAHVGIVGRQVRASQQLVLAEIQITAQSTEVELSLVHRLVGGEGLLFLHRHGNILLLLGVCLVEVFEERLECALGLECAVSTAVEEEGPQPPDRPLALPQHLHHVGHLLDAGVREGVVVQRTVRHTARHPLQQELQLRIAPKRTAAPVARCEREAVCSDVLELHGRQGLVGLPQHVAHTVLDRPVGMVEVGRVEGYDEAVDGLVARVHGGGVGAEAGAGEAAGVAVVGREALAARDDCGLQRKQGGHQQARHHQLGGDGETNLLLHTTLREHAAAEASVGEVGLQLVGVLDLVVTGLDHHLAQHLLRPAPPLGAPAALRHQPAELDRPVHLVAVALVDDLTHADEVQHEALQLLHLVGLRVAEQTEEVDGQTSAARRALLEGQDAQETRRQQREALLGRQRHTTEAARDERGDGRPEEPAHGEHAAAHLGDGERAESVLVRRRDGLEDGVELFNGEPLAVREGVLQLDDELAEAIGVGRAAAGVLLDHIADLGPLGAVVTRQHDRRVLVRHTR
mmetsp:Transcript_14236/g.40931  ORF Transcript_14236/g.40931 Transcript_14236/m.40931 type:complete len:522 (-) Transcript_14236:59-1624(-)